MTSDNNKNFSRKQSSGYFEQRERFLWPSPAVTGWVSRKPSKQTILWSNHAPTLAKLSAALPAYNIYSLDCGGFALKDAVALDTIDRQTFAKIFCGNASSEKHEGHTLFLPVSLASILSIQNGEQLGTYRVCYCSDHPEKVAHPIHENDQVPIQQSSAFAPFIQRLWIGLRLAVGQACIFVLPLSLFGWWIAITGISLLFCCAVFLAVLWKVLPLRPLVKGGIWAGVFSLVAFGFQWLVFPPFAADQLWIVFVVGLITFWISILFSGMRAS